MGTFRTIRCLCGASAASLVIMLAGPARSAVVISKDATQNMNCSGGICEPTAPDAVLNSSDLETLLASGNVKVTTKGSATQAGSIRISVAFGWATASTLRLDAHDKVQIDAGVTVKGKGGVVIATHAFGAVFFGPKGHLTFADLASVVSIDGPTLTLENSIKSLAKAFANNPSGWYALANDYDAGSDGTYTKAPIHTQFEKGQPHFEGLGNTVSNLTIAGAGGDIGLFASNIEGNIRDIRLKDVSVTSTRGTVGTLVGYNAGGLSGGHAAGTVTVSGRGSVGGLVGANTNRGFMKDDDANVAVVVGEKSDAGGLAGSNGGSISECYALGNVTGSGRNVQVGGLAGFNVGGLGNTYARGSAEGGSDSGGLMGENGAGLAPGAAFTSYSTGRVEAKDYAGGVIGFDEVPGLSKHVYWDLTTSGIGNRSQGAGSPPNDHGLHGIRTKRLRSGLPNGFDSRVWAERTTINDGLPYLISDPPE